MVNRFRADGFGLTDDDGDDDDDGKQSGGAAQFIPASGPSPPTATITSPHLTSLASRSGPWHGKSLEVREYSVLFGMRFCGHRQELLIVAERRRGGVPSSIMWPTHPWSMALAPFDR